MQIPDDKVFDKLVECAEKATRAETNTERLFQVAASIKQNLDRVGDKVVAQIAEENKKMLTETELLILKAIAANNNKISNEEIKPIKRVVGLVIIAVILIGGDRIAGLFL